MSAVLATALELHGAGYCPIRAATNGTKAPLGRWQTYQSERPTVEQLRAWFGNGHAGIGVVTGAVSGNVEVLEFEGRALIEGVFAAWGQLMVASGLGDLMVRLLAGYLDATPGGGWHIHYRVEGKPVLGNTKLARRPATADELTDNPDDQVKVLIETRGEGGFVVTAPSNGATHPTGRPWQRKVGGPRTTPVLTVDEHDALMAVCRALDRMPRPEPVARPEPTSVGPADALFQSPSSGSGRPGDDFNSRIGWAEILEPHGWTQIYTDGGGTAYWRRPGKAIGTSATTGYGDGDYLYVFSTSTVFDAERAYDKFGAYAVLNHGGDFTAASRALADAGWGEQKSAPLIPAGVAEVDADGFWGAREELARIRLYAQAQMASPWAVLTVVLARIVCQIPTAVVLPRIILGYASLNLTVALVSASGGGKGGATSVASDAVTIGVPAFQTHTLGSGQGIAHGFGHWNTKAGGVERHADSVLFTVEEVDHLAGHQAMLGSTTLSELRRFSMGEKLGSHYVDHTRRVQIPAHSYRGAIIISIQPGRAGVLLDSVEGGDSTTVLLDAGH